LEEGADPSQIAPYKNTLRVHHRGPVYIPNHYNSSKKKTFFFFSEEWRREKLRMTTIRSSPFRCRTQRGFLHSLPPHPLIARLFRYHPQFRSMHRQALLCVYPSPNTTNGTFDCATL